MESDMIGGLACPCLATQLPDPLSLLDNWRLNRTMPNYLEVSSLGKCFAAHGRHAFEDISFSVAKGEFVALIGPSGCGKSTLLHIVAGLSRPTSGHVSLNGEPITSPRVDLMFVFQQYTKSIFPWKTVMDNVRLAVKYLPNADRRKLDALCRTQLEHVGLGRYGNYYPYQLSGGMQQRVAIARALARRPDTLLMDEPFSALDAMMRVELQDLLLNLWGELKLTIVFVTHDLDEALYLAQRVIVLSASPGKIAEVVDVPLAYPRNQVTTRSDPRYLNLRERLYRVMVEQVTAARAAEP
jgi:NitT/TauT family transport system ATP-binding protein